MPHAHIGAKPMQGEAVFGEFGEREREKLRRQQNVTRNQKQGGNMELTTQFPKFHQPRRVWIVTKYWTC